MTGRIIEAAILAIGVAIGGALVGSGFARAKSADRYVTVKTVHGSKITQRGRLPPESLARIMLRELADEGKA